MGRDKQLLDNYMFYNKDYLLYEHGGSYNHGCEAIVRTTVNLLGLNKSNCVLLSQDKKSDLQFGLNKCISVRQLSQRYLQRNSFQGYLGRLKCRLHQKSYDNYEFAFNQRSFTKYQPKVALSIGGDNYCYGSCYQLIDHNRALRNSGALTVLWGCSLNDLSQYPQLCEDLAKFDLITPRESITYDILKRNKIKTQIVKCADPAFTLDFKPIDLPWGKNCKVIGVNISPLVIAFENRKNVLYENYCNLLDYIINYQGLNVVLIPHVNNAIQEWTNDYGIAKKLYDRFNNRVFLVGDDLNCQELKYIISKCELFIGARTHATIAAYSTCVPTLVVGYSTKAKGIAMDIFGKEENNYVIDAGSLNNENVLVEHYKALYKVRDHVADYLVDFMPNYKKSALLGAAALKGLMS